MKIFIFITTLLIARVHLVYSQHSDTLNLPVFYKYLSLDLHKSIPLQFDGSGYVIEPEVIFQRKNIIFPVLLGISEVNKILYDDFKYKSNGKYMKLGVGFQTNYYKDENGSDHTIFGISGIVSYHNEVGNKVLEGYYFDDYIVDMTRSNVSYGVEIFFSFRKIFKNDFFIVITPKIAINLDELDYIPVPVYYLPGFGVIRHNFGSEYGGVAVESSFRIGYKF